MKKRWVLAAIILVLVLSKGALAGEKLLTVAEAALLMEEHNLSLKIAGRNLELAELDYRRAVASNLMTDSHYANMQAEYNLERAKNAYASARNSSYLEVYRAFTDVVQAQATLDVRRIEEEIAVDNYRVMREKVRIGDAGRLDELRELNQLETAKRNTHVAEQTLAERWRSLQRLTGLHGQTVGLVLPESVPEFEFTVDQSIELALTASFDVWEREYNLKLQRLLLAKERVDGTPPIDIQRTEVNKEIAQLNVLRAVAETVEGVTSSYYSLQQAISRYEGAVLDHDIARESFEISQRQAEAGLITAISLLQSELGLMRAANARSEARIAYGTSLIQFQQLLGMDGQLP